MQYTATSLNTKIMLSSSLKKLMEKKPFSKISVREIVADCGVNRNTFYYHFQDIRDLLKWTLEREAIEVVKKFDLLINYKQAILFVMDYAEKNKHLINCAYDSIGRDELKRFFYNDFLSITASLFDSAEKSVGKKLPPDYKDFLIRFFTEAISGVLLDWIKDRNSYTPEKMTLYLERIIEDEIGHLKKFLQNEL